MLPRWHILLGLIFTALIWFISPEISLIYLVVLFLSSFLIDTDHYINACNKTGKLSLGRAFNYYKEQDKRIERMKAKGIRKKGDFHLFHTIEFHALIGLAGYFFPVFFYIFIGMVFHSLLDILGLVYNDRIYLREFFFSNWLFEKFR